MLNDFRAGMAEATRLTRAGRLEEATAFIQRLIGAIRGTRAPEPAPAPDPAPDRPRDVEDAVIVGETVVAEAVATPDAAREQPRREAPGRTRRPRRARERRPGLHETLRRLAEQGLPAGAGKVAPPVPAGARFENAAYSGPLGARDYRLFVPAGADAAEAPLPLVVMMHGCTQNPEAFALATGMNVAAGEAGVIVAYPAQAFTANPKRCWNWFRPEDQRRDAGEPALIAGIVRQVLATENADAARIYVAGMSAGGAAAATLGAAYPDLFAAVGVHSGLPHGAASDLGSALAAMRQGARGAAPARPVRTIVFHGDADRTVNAANADALAAQATAAGSGLSRDVERGEAGGRAYSREIHSDAAGRTVCELWTIHGAGHAWSGGKAGASHADPLGPDATREMLRFFLEG